jgi:hypothetical protein
LNDLLFADQSKLDQDGLMDKARTLKLDEQQFESCLGGTKFKAQIQQDSQDGMRRGERHSRILHQWHIPERQPAGERVREFGSGEPRILRFPETVSASLSLRQN